MQMIGLDEGKQIHSGAFRISMMILFISTILNLFILLFAYFNGYMGKREQSMNTGMYENFVDLMQENPVPVRSVYTALQSAKEKDFYFLSVTYKKPDGSVTTNVFTNEENIDMSDDDRDAFHEAIQEQFNVDLPDESSTQDGNAVNRVRAILHSFTDRMCEVYYNPEHSDSENYYPPYIYIIVRDDLAGNS